MSKFATKQITPGTNGQILTTVSGAAAWAAVPFDTTAAVITTQQGTSSSTYTDLGTVGPAVTVTTGTSVLVIISVITSAANTNGTNFVSPVISGATTVAAGTYFISNAQGNFTGRNYQLGGCCVVTGLTAGSNTFTLQYKNDAAATTNFGQRTITVILLN